MTHGRSRAGIALLEVLAATFILSAAVVGWLTLVAQLRHSLAEATVREGRIRRASSALAYASAMPAESLDAWYAGHPFAEYRIRARRIGGTLFDVAVEDSLSRVPLLTTTVHAMPASRGAP